MLAELRENMDKYLSNPGTIALSKALLDLYRNLDLSEAKLTDESCTGNNRSEAGNNRSEAGVNESENESHQAQAREHIVRMDNQAFEFEPINTTAVGAAD